MIPGFGGPMQLLRGEVDRFQRLAAQARDDFSAYRQCSYDSGYCDVIVDKRYRLNFPTF